LQDNPCDCDSRISPRITVDPRDQHSNTWPNLRRPPLENRRQVAVSDFLEIVVPPGYDVNYFQNYFTNNPGETPDGPDADDND
jgi:hypothetical protein